MISFLSNPLEYIKDFWNINKNNYKKPEVEKKSNRFISGECFRKVDPYQHSYRIKRKGCCFGRYSWKIRWF